MLSSDLMELWNRRWRESERRKAVYCERGEQYGRDCWLISPQDGTQIHLWEFLAKKIFIFAIVPPGPQPDKGYRCWLNGQGQGLFVEGKCTDEPIPEDALSALKQALPAPPPLSLWGQWQDGVLVALYQMWEDDSTDMDVLTCSEFFLRDTPRPDMFTKNYLDLRKWWAAVDRKTLENIGEKVVQAEHPIRCVKLGNGLVRSVEIAEPWTGIEGSALYVYEKFGRKDAPLTKAQLRGAVDIRPGFILR